VFHTKKYFVIFEIMLFIFVNFYMLSYLFLFEIIVIRLWWCGKKYFNSFW